MREIFHIAQNIIAAFVLFLCIWEILETIFKDMRNVSK